MNANIQAVGSYLRRLRELKGLTRTKVAAEFDTVEAQISNIETGRRETRGSMLLNMVVFLEGSLDDVAELMLSEQATPERARRMAELHFASRIHEEQQGALAVAESGATYQTTEE